MVLQPVIPTVPHSADISAMVLILCVVIVILLSIPDGAHLFFEGTPFKCQYFLCAQFVSGTIVDLRAFLLRRYPVFLLQAHGQGRGAGHVDRGIGADRDDYQPVTGEGPQALLLPTPTCRA